MAGTDYGANVTELRLVFQMHFFRSGETVCIIAFGMKFFGLKRKPQINTAGVIHARSSVVVTVARCIDIITQAILLIK